MQGERGDGQIEIVGLRPQAAMHGWAGCTLDKSSPSEEAWPHPHRRQRAVHLLFPEMAVKSLVLIKSMHCCQMSPRWR